MERILILVRHGQAGHSMNHVDFERPLTAVGEQDVKHLGRWIEENFNEVKAMVSSCAIRAKLTAEIIEEQLKQDITINFNEDLYEASVRIMLSVINKQCEDFHQLILVGHNPTISYLAEYLTNTVIPGMEPGSAVVIQFNDIEWKEIKQNSGKLRLYKSPERI